MLIMFAIETSIDCPRMNMMVLSVCTAVTDPESWILDPESRILLPTSFFLT